MLECVVIILAIVLSVYSLAEIVKLPATADREEVTQVTSEYDLVAVPVVDAFDGPQDFLAAGPQAVPGDAGGERAVLRVGLKR